ncbi:MAG: DUF63 family protein [Candidatus Anstonellaceae archaeon]
MEDIIKQYFVNPIFDRVGYNPVNTAVYAAIALASIYLIWKVLHKRYDFSSKEFLYGALAFVLLGSTSRVLTDLSDAGAIRVASNWGGEIGGLYSALDAWGIFDYGYLTVTPGIYIVIAILFLLSIAIGMVMKRPLFPAIAGIALWIPCFLLLIPFMAHFLYALLALGMALGGAAAMFWLIRKAFGEETGVHPFLSIFGQALDGAATFVVIDIFGKTTGKAYFEQHVLSSAIGHATPLGFGLFFLLKLVLATAITYLIFKENMRGDERALAFVVIAIMGFAPGIRNLLRMLCGT